MGSSDMANPPERGRPTKYDESCDEDLKLFLAEGYSFASACARLDIDPATGYRWVQKYPTFRDAYKKGKALGQATWEKMALDHVVEGRDGDKVKLNAAIWIFNMKAKYGWSESPEEMMDDESYPEP